MERFLDISLKIAEKRREAKVKGENERYTHLMKISKEQQGEIRKPSSVINAKNRGNQQNRKDQRSLQENQRYQGTFHAKMGTIKDRNGLDLTEAEDIKKRRQEYTEEQYKKDLYDPDNHDGVITQLDPDILECEVKWALESITMNKAS